MSKNSGPYFEFDMERDGPSIRFVFYPGNIAEEKFNEVVAIFTNLFKNTYGQANDYLKVVEREIEKNGKSQVIKTISIFESKVPAVLKAMLSDNGKTSSPFKLRINGEDKDGNPKSVTLDNYLDVTTKLNEIVPMYNKNNNDRTSKRRK